MIVIKGISYFTVADAAKQFEVSTKTVYEWIDKGIIPAPKKVSYGIRKVQVFPPEYIKVAKQKIEAYQQLNSSSA